MIFIRADGGREIGSGHIMRCLSIAGALQRQGQEVLFILADDSAAGLLTERGQKYRILDSDCCRMEKELSVLRPLLEAYRPKLFLADSYFVTEDYLKQVGKYTKTAYIDDLGMFPCPADVVINYNIYGEALPYREKALPQNRAFLLGCSYAPLREEFENAVYAVREKAAHVLITTGGGDKYNLAEQILGSVLSEETCRRLQYHVVSGSFNSHLPSLQAVAAKHPNVKVYENIRNMAALMAQCDIAVTAGGSTMYELCAVGVPIICFSFVDNQERLVETFAQKGIVCYGGNYLREKEELPKKAAGYVRLLAESKTLREDYSRLERGLVDGRGAERIAKELLKH